MITMKIKILNRMAIELKNDNNAVHINSRDISWGIIRIQPNMEYLEDPENEDKIKKKIDRAESIIVKTNDRIQLMI